MGRFLVRRIVSSIITLLLFATVVFFVAKVMMPGDFTNNFMPGLGDRRAVLQAELGLDRSVFGQWWRFMGSFCETTDGRPILDLMTTLLPWSLSSGAIVADGFVSFLGFSDTRLNWGTIIFFAMSLPPGDRAGIPWEAIVSAAMAISLYSAAFYLVGLGFRDIARATD